MPRISRDVTQHSGYLDLARSLIEAGDDDRAREAVVKGRNLPGNDTAAHRTWGTICEELGMARQARESYERALRLNAGDGEARLRLAVLLAEVGHYEQSLDQLRRLLHHDPAHQEARRLLAENCRLLGLAGQAEALQPAGKPVPSSPLRYFPPSIGTRDTETMLRLFAGREIGYAVQEISSATGELSYEHRDVPLTHELVRDHLSGNISLGVYPLRSDNTARYAALAIRPRAGARETRLNNPSAIRMIEEKMRHHALALAARARQRSLPVELEQGADNHFRLWFFFKDGDHFLRLKTVIGAFVETLPVAPADIVVEPLLATRPVGIGWVEHAIPLPLGMDLGTQRRSLWVDVQGEPYPEQLKALRRIRQIPLRQALEMMRASRSARPLGTGSALDALHPAAQRLCRACAVVRGLVREASSGRLLRREQKVALFYTLGLVDRDGGTLHQVLNATPDYDYQKVERQLARLQPNPISCLKIRDLLPELTASVGCNCVLDLRGGKYPSPLLHIHPHLVPSTEAVPAEGKGSARAAAR
ncbi:MAG TPA: hypothetical protein DEO88_01990, partial [Syntrophobacteraceae bacterium]|nr:hypothetical protein [Syntrophobacteraceae bacterium]